MTTAMDEMGRSVVCLALELPAEVYADVATKWDAACAEHLAAVAALEDEVDDLRTVLHDFDRFASAGAGAHEYVCSPLEAEVKDALGEPVPDCL